MNLQNKKELAARALGVGKKRIIFNQEGLPEIKEAITKQDIFSLVEEGIISLKPITGRKKKEKRKTKKGPGKIKKKIKQRKQTYVKITRKLRAYIKQLKNSGKIDIETYRDVRKKIKMSTFKSKAHLREYLENPIQSKGSKEKVSSKQTFENKVEKQEDKPKKVRKTTKKEKSE